MSHESRCLKILKLTVLITGLVATGSASAKIKCWTNNEGVRECGNSVPPEYAQQGHEEKSAGGVTVQKTARAKSIDELEAEKVQAEERALAAMRAKEQAAKDRVLLDTFSSEDDMILARDGQISHLDSQVKITESHIEKLKLSLEGFIQDAADFERRGQQPPEKLVGDIESFRQQVRENEAFIATKAAERKAIYEKFDLDIARFRELKGEPSS